MHSRCSGSFSRRDHQQLPFPQPEPDVEKPPPDHLLESIAEKPTAVPNRPITPTVRARWRSVSKFYVYCLFPKVVELRSGILRAKHCYCRHSRNVRGFKLQSSNSDCMNASGALPATAPQSWTMPLIADTGQPTDRLGCGNLVAPGVPIKLPNAQVLRSRLRAMVK